MDEKDLIGYDIFDEPNAPRADGLITNSSKITLYNYADDCAICFFLDPIKKVIGCVHASWKGSLLGIFEKEIRSFTTTYGSNKKDIVAVLAPSIGVDSFEVGDDCAEQFEKIGFSSCINYKSYDKLPINLPEINRQILLNCGLKKRIFMLSMTCVHIKMLSYFTVIVEVQSQIQELT